MNRRELLKFSLLSPLLGLFKSRKSSASTGLTYIKGTTGGASAPCCRKEFYETTGTSGDPIHFWMQTYGLHYDPSSFGIDWTNADSTLLGIYHGEELLGKKAIDWPIGTRVVRMDGARYMCYGPTGIYMKGKGVFLNEPQTNT